MELEIIVIVLSIVACGILIARNYRIAKKNEDIIYDFNSAYDYFLTNYYMLSWTMDGNRCFTDVDALSIRFIVYMENDTTVINIMKVHSHGVMRKNTIKDKLVVDFFSKILSTPR